MKLQGLTQEALAAKLGLSHSAVSRWLSGSIPRTARLADLAEALSVSVSYLEGGDELPPSAVRKSREPPVGRSSPGDWETLFRKVAEDSDIDWLLDRLDQLGKDAVAGEADAALAISIISPILRKRIASLRSQTSPQKK